MVFDPAVGHHRAPVPRDEAPRAPPREVSTGALPRPHVLDAFPSLDPSRVAPPPRPPPRERRLAPSRRARLIGALDVQPVRHPALHLAPNLERHLCAPPSRLARVIRRSPLERRPSPTSIQRRRHSRSDDARRLAANLRAALSRCPRRQRARTRQAPKGRATLAEDAADWRRLVSAAETPPPPRRARTIPTG